MDKRVLILTASAGGLLGGYLPVLLGADSLSAWSLLGGLIGGLVGIWVGVKISE